MGREHEAEDEEETEICQDGNLHGTARLPIWRRNGEKTWARNVRCPGDAPRRSSKAKFAI